jgi:AraC-like DNA-binding protein
MPQISLFSVIILLGCVQASVLTLVLFFSAGQKTVAQKYLAWFILLFAYNAFETFLFSINSPLQAYTLNRFVPLFHLFCTGPLLLLYVQSTISFEHQTRRKWLYFLPAIICFALNLTFTVIFESGVFEKSQLAGLFRTYDSILEAERLGMVIVFSWFLYQSRKILWQWKREMPDNNGGSKEENEVIYRSLSRFLLVLFILLLVWGATIFGSFFLGQTFSLQFYIPLEISLAFAMYWLAFVGHQRIRVVQVEKQKVSQSVVEMLDEQQLAMVVQKLKTAMDTDKHYLNPELNLNLLSELTSLNPRVISAVCNQVFNKGFGEFVNEYRIEEAKRQLVNPKNQHLTIASIAYDSGFNSLPTFQRAFRQIMNQTPKEYQNSLQKH